MKRILFLSSVFLISFVAQASTYRCSDDRGGKVEMILSFEGKVLNQATVKNFPYKKFPQVLKMKSEQLKLSISENSEEKFKVYDFNLRQVKEGIDPFYYGSNVRFSFHYPIMKHGKALSLDQSLMEKNSSVNGTRYGKLRLDIDIDAITESHGSTYTFFCKKSR